MGLREVGPRQARPEPVEVGENSDDVPKDTVIRTEPGSGTNVARNQSIRVVVSLGPEQVAVPDLAGQTQDAAQQALKSAGFEVGAINTDYSPDVPEGTVMSSDPGSSTQLAKGSVVNLTVSNGKVQLPNVTQQPFQTANATLAQLGLTVQPAPAYSCIGGTVLQQSVPAGDVAQGSTIVLTYCAASAQNRPSSRRRPPRARRRRVPAASRPRASPGSRPARVGSPAWRIVAASVHRLHPTRDRVDPLSVRRIRPAATR